MNVLLEAIDIKEQNQQQQQRLQQQLQLQLQHQQQQQRLLQQQRLQQQQLLQYQQRQPGGNPASNNQPVVSNPYLTRALPNVNTSLLPHNTPGLQCISITIFQGQVPMLLNDEIYFFAPNPLRIPIRFESQNRTIFARVPDMTVKELHQRLAPQVPDKDRKPLMLEWRRGWEGDKRCLVEEKNVFDEVPIGHGGMQLDNDVAWRVLVLDA